MKRRGPITGKKLKGYDGEVQFTQGYEVLNHDNLRFGLYLKHGVAEYFASFAGRTLHDRTMVMIEHLGVQYVVPIDNRQSLTALGVHEYKEVAHKGYLGQAKISLGYELVGVSREMRWRVSVHQNILEAYRVQRDLRIGTVRPRLIIEIGEGYPRHLYVLNSPLLKDFHGYKLQPRFTRVGDLSTTFIKSLCKVT